VQAARRVAEVGEYCVSALHSRTTVELWPVLPTTEMFDTRRPGVPAPADGQVARELVVPCRG
jgi:hypothetical protein